MDGAIGSLEVLPEIVDAVGNDITVLFDSGVRTGVDVTKALCLGAKAVYRTAVVLWAGNSGEGGCKGGVAGDIRGLNNRYNRNRESDFDYNYIDYISYKASKELVYILLLSFNSFLYIFKLISIITKAVVVRNAIRNFIIVS